MSRLALTDAERKELRQALDEWHGRTSWRRLVALLDVDGGQSVSGVAEKLGVSRRSVHHWVQAYRSGGSVLALGDRPRPGRPSRWNEDLSAVLEMLLAESPESYGYPGATWTVPMLQEQLRHRCETQLAEDTVRRQLHRLGYSWKRSRYVLEPDPERGEKDKPDPSRSGAPGAQERGAGGR